MKDSVYKHALFVTTILGAIAAGPIVGHAQQQNNDAKASGNNDTSAANVLSKPVATSVTTQPEPVTQQQPTAPVTEQPVVTEPVPVTQEPVTEQPVTPVAQPPATEQQPVTAPVEEEAASQSKPSEAKPVVTEPVAESKPHEQTVAQPATAKVNTKELKKKIAVRSVSQKKKQQATTSKSLVKQKTTTMKKASKTLKTASTVSYNNSIKDTFKDANLSKAVAGLLNEDLGSINEDTIFTEDMALYYDKVDFKEAGISNIGATRFLVKS